jgi:hypothetical protein
MTHFVYYLRSGRTVVYVGRSFKPNVRLNDARIRFKDSELQIKKTVAFESFELACDFERAEIKRLHPKYNLVARSAKGNLGHTGYKLPEGTGLKIAAKLLGSKRTPEQCRKISASRMGLSYGPHTPEHNAKIGASLLGQKRGKYGAKHRAAISAGKRKFDAERRQALFEEMMGTIFLMQTGGRA